jgi:membrane protein implicated in regulation of membrane protease activity
MFYLRIKNTYKNVYFPGLDPATDSIWDEVQSVLTTALPELIKLSWQIFLAIFLSFVLLVAAAPQRFFRLPRSRLRPKRLGEVGTAKHTMPMIDRLFY